MDPTDFPRLQAAAARSERTLRLVKVFAVRLGELKAEVESNLRFARRDLVNLNERLAAWKPSR